MLGPNDNFDLQSSHVLPAMIRKFHEAKLNDNSTCTLWGDGMPMREFLHVDDLASAVLFAVEKTLEGDIYNVGTGEDLLIKDLAKDYSKRLVMVGKLFGIQQNLMERQENY